MKNYKINFTNNTITVTKEFAQNAQNPTSEEYALLTKLKTDYPNIQVVNKTHSSPKKCNPARGLTYKAMERYINTFANADEVLEVFELVKERSSVQANRYKYVKDWFEAQFPDYRKLPVFGKGDNAVVLRQLPAKEECEEVA